MAARSAGSRSRIFSPLSSTSPCVDLIALAAGDHIGERRLAGAVRPHDGRNLAVLYGERKTLEDFAFADRDVEVLDFEHCKTLSGLWRHGRP